MRAANLAKVAAQAELLRIQYMLKRQGMRVALGLIAAIFLLAVITFANVAGWQVASMYVAPIYATLIMLGMNLLLSVIFGILGIRSAPSRGERDALQVRQQALQEARSALTISAIVPIAGALLRSRRKDNPKRSFWRRLP